MAKNRKTKSAEVLTAEIPSTVMFQDAVCGYAEIERSEGDDLDVDIHLWPVDADHRLSEDLKCDCQPRVDIKFASGVRVIIHRKTQ